MKRRYEQKERAESTQETRRRIAAVTADLHQSIGPRATTVSEIARRAGVGRLTVYNHFPEEADLVAACQAHWLGLHPPPAPAAWMAIADPRQRLRQVLADLYRFYGETADMTANVLRDAPALPSFAQVLERIEAAQASTVRLLAEGFAADGKKGRYLAATLAVAIGFPTWERLVRQGGLDAGEAIELASGWVEAVITI
jgi:AcrR family transcriptional regulator